ncbi:1-acyl-sn-glycerol-3-phosphate acyltransferase [Thermosporothrix hazakensis]|uniref:1-acyl-sn-glycerol-3-phosphate acyltransferase n=2 Tax=Thermosporothrix TaxID=768650 RepID=A0A326U7Y8_THEHA|nr:lysophospholipid acyltransferase family protein [Thermosporothrix hazakensis]PZW29295.1 1-acyl-sn-glycerol-3-phosphate acyltransferase [Thermosporothrix hazakensis]BBH86226.1 hypothetical protein KTC_09770 [Thermosporothrix sp. COM3]GCE45352.1 hypothetical protein KTH_02210 [Thermosporothrix hazakensis]
MYRFVALIARLLLPLFFRISFSGREHVPSQGGAVLACNHVSWLDVIFLAYAVQPRPVHYMAKRELFQHKLIARFLRSIHAFPVNRENPGPSALKTPLQLLREGKVVGIFPGGTRKSEDIALKQGAVTIALRADVPLIPARYRGPLRLRISYLFRRPEVSIQFMPALEMPQEADRKQTQLLATQRLSELLGGIV